MSKFPWGNVIDRFIYDFDGETMEVTKYHPWVSENGFSKRGIVDESSVQYHCEEISESSDFIFALLLSWIAYKKIGLNNGSLVRGIARALEIF